MIISIDDRLQSLYFELKKLGYDVHRVSENVRCDTVIYSGQDTHIADLNVTCSDGNNGAFLINGDHMRGEEISNMIRNRLYSSLF